MAAARTAIIDCIGCMLAGTSTALGKIARQCAQQEGGAPRATVVGYGYRTSAGLATFINGTTGHALD